MLMKRGCRMAACEATSLVTKLWMKRAFNARNSSIVSSDWSLGVASCIVVSSGLSKRQLARLLCGGVIRREKAFDLDLLQHRVRRHCERGEGGKEREPEVAPGELHDHDGRGGLRLARKPPFGG